LRDSRTPSLRDPRSFGALFAHRWNVAVERPGGRQIA